MKMRFLSITLNVLLFWVGGFANTSISICSWNIENLGKSKSDVEIDFMANTIKNYDVIAIVEVVAGDGGAQAVARLSDAWLEKKYNVEIDREPFFSTFKTEGKEFTLVSFHAITKSQQPETEIKYFKFLPAEYPVNNLMFCGDFNCPESHTVFNPFKSMGYKPIITGQKTSLKQECVNEDCLASEYDNIFYNSAKVTFIKSAVINFYKSFPTLKDARVISDHIPIYFSFSLN